MEDADFIVRVRDMDLKSLQKPLKEKYRADPSASRTTLKASGSQSAAPVACSVDIGRAVYEAEAHTGVGGPGTAACSGDLLLGALAACAQITCQMVAAAMGVPVERIEVTVEGDLDLRGTLGLSRRPASDSNRSGWASTSTPSATVDQIRALGKRPSNTASSCRRWRAPRSR
jgi:hypothetical protein